MALRVERYHIVGGVLTRRGKTDRQLSAPASVAVTFPVDNATLASGTITISAIATGATGLKFKLGQVLKTATQGPVGTWSYAFDTTINPNSGLVASDDFAVSIQAIASFAAGPDISSAIVWAKTSNLPVVPLPAAGGWRPEIAWSANHSGTVAQWKSSYEYVRGYQADGITPTWSLIPDPTGRSRQVIRAIVPNNVDRGDQPTGNVRFQAQAPRSSGKGIREGDEFCVGYSIMVSNDFPEMYGNNDPEDPDYPDANGMGYINLFQFWGPDNIDGTNSYVGGSPWTTGVRRRGPGENTSNGAFTRKQTVQSQEVYAGNPDTHLQFAYPKMKWVDIVHRVHISLSIERGWVETYINLGDSATVQPVLLGGKLRIPRILRKNATHQDWRTDVQIYRRVNEIDSLTAYFYGHKHAQTIAQADPLSYA